MHHGTTPMSYVSVSQNESPNNPFGFSVSSPQFPHSKTDAVFRFQWPCCLSPWDWWASWAFEALGHWSWRCVNLMMFCVFLVLSHAHPRMISTVSIKQFVGSAFHFNLETRSVTCHTSGHLHFHTTLRYDQILEAVHCGGFPPLLQEKHQWSYGVKPWMVGSPGGTWWRKWWPDQVMKTTQIHQEILETKSKQSKYPKQSNI